MFAECSLSALSTFQKVERAKRSKGLTFLISEKFIDRKETYYCWKALGKRILHRRRLYKAFVPIKIVLRINRKHVWKFDGSLKQGQEYQVRLPQDVA